MGRWDITANKAYEKTITNADERDADCRRSKC